MKIKLFIFCTALSTSLFAGDRKTCIGHAPGEDIYKHYTGIIGSRKVIVDLRYGFCGASNYGGTYVYDINNGQVHKLMIGEPESFAHDVTLSGTEMDIQQDWMDAVDRNDLPKWSFTIGAGKLAGKCTTNGKEEVLELTEDNSNAAQVSLVSFTDSMKTMKPGKPMGAVYYSYIGIEPATTMPAADARFLKDQLFAIGQDKSKDELNTLGSFLSQSAFTDFKTSYESLPDDTANSGWKAVKRIYSNNVILPISNNNGILVLEHSSSRFIGGSYNYVTAYTNLDMKGRKVWTLDNMIESKTGKQKLLNLLRDANAKIEGKAGKQTISRQLEEIPANVAIVHSGLLFYKTGQPEQCLYVPYTKLKGILSTDLSKRIGL